MRPRMRMLREGAGVGSRGQGPRESDSGQHAASMASLPACLGLQHCGFYLSMTLFFLGLPWHSSCQAQQPHL